jgi:taurine--2-oxoglutarate transaminase
MTIRTAPERLTSEQIVELSRRHTIFPWTAQGAVAPIAIDRAEGVWLYTPEGRRILDFNSQLMSVNIGHGDRRVIDAITEQALKLQYVQPAFVTEIRARLGQKLAEILPGDMDHVFFTLGGAEANEPGISGVVRFPDTHRFGEKEPRSAAEALQGLADVVQYEGPNTIAAVILETVVGTNGILIPPDGYLQGVREICDRHGIMLIADEVMAGFGRTGEWFAVNHWNVVPDMITLAKGLTSSYLPLGVVGMRPHVAEAFEKKVFYGGLTYSSHPVSLASALATIAVYEEDGLIERAKRMGDVMRGHHEALAAKHRSIGSHRNIGLFGILELVRSHDPWTPMSSFNATSDEMKAVQASLREQGLYTMYQWNGIHTNPPLTITEEELALGFEMIDRALEKADEAVTG